MAGIILRPRSRMLRGHDWVYRTEILKTFGNPNDGDVISIKDGHDQMLGSAIYNSRSEIVARRFSYRRQKLSLRLFEQRIYQANQWRDNLGLPKEYRRVVWSDSDGLPGVIVDRFNSIAVIQTLTLAMDQHLDFLIQAVIKVLDIKTIIERNDSISRQLEGLENRIGVLYGDPADKQLIQIAGVSLTVDTLKGQKTGFYLDQARNYQKIAVYARGKNILDCFANQGAFSLICAYSGAKSVTSVESSEENIKILKENAQINDLSLNVMHDDVFDFLGHELRKGKQYDLIILDPPPFMRKRKNLSDSLRAYRDLHLKAIKLLTQNGLLVSFCCSQHMMPSEFQDMIREALHTALRKARIIQLLKQSPDHPISVNLPESSYLQGIVYQLFPSF